MKSQKETQSLEAVTHTHTGTSKNRKNGIIKLVVFLVILTICLGGICEITKRKYAYTKMEDFFEQEEDFDVLFFGSSHMLNGIYPMKLWNDYGIVSYDMGNHNETIVESYYNLFLALKETNPKLVVLDLYQISQINKYISKYETQVHNILDAYPVSYMKFLAIKDIFEGESLLDRGAEFFFNFSMYHSRWSELTEEDFTIKHTYEKGAESRIAVATPNETSEFNDIDVYDDEETVNMEYLRKMIEYCKSNDIEILLVYLPHPATDLNISCSKYAETITEEYNVNYINFLDMDLVNYNTDCYDSASHLNPSGARKVTDYIGNYIMENYDIQDQRENESYSFWYEDYDEYIDLKISNLNANKSKLNNYLMLLYGEEDISYEIKISSELEIEEGSTLEELLENLDNNYEIDDEAFYEENEETGELEKLDKTIKITTWDNRTGEEINTVWFKE